MEKLTAPGFTVKDLAEHLTKTWRVPVEVNMEPELSEKYTLKVNARPPKTLAPQLEEEYGLFLRPFFTTATEYTLN